MLEAKNNRIAPGIGLQFLLSFYTAFLLVLLEETRAFGWSIDSRYLYLWHPHATSLREVDFVLFYAELFLLPTLAVFFVLRIGYLFPPVRYLVSFFMGAMAVAGIPLVYLCIEHSEPDRWLPNFAGFALLSICFVSRLTNRRNATPFWPVAGMIIHFGWWCFVAWSSLGMSRLASSSLPESYIWFLMPVIGLSYTALWTKKYFRVAIQAGGPNRPVA